MIATYGLYCSAPAARALASQLNAGDQSIQNVVSAAITTAVNSGLVSTTASVSGYAPLDVQTNMNILTQMGYTVSLSVTTLSVAW